MASYMARRDLLAHAHFLQSNKIPFLFCVNNHTYEIRSQLGTYRTLDNLIKRKELWFIKYVKDYIMRNEIYKKIPNDLPRNYRKSILYFKYNKENPSEVYDKDVYEVDINQAYWETAYRLGIIDAVVFRKGLEVGKKVRLAALGTLAKRTDIYKNTGATMKYFYTEESSKTEYLWFKICQRLGQVMNKARKAVGKDFIFYWVDGIYVIGEKAVKKSRRAFESEGYQHKTEKIDMIAFKPEEHHVLVVEQGERPEKGRKYPLARVDNPLRYGSKNQ